MVRKIIHIDMDAFYASVEQRDNPALRGKPIAVGQADGRGVVAAASYEARKFGVRSAMSSSKAKRLCPGLIFTECRFDVYKQVSQQIHEIFHRYTDIIEPISLDEAFLDVTDSLTRIPLAVEIARRIKQDIRDELSLIASAGVSFNKFLAKIASDYRKPDGLCVIPPQVAEEFIAKMPVESFWGVGPVTAARMHSMGIYTGGDLRRLSAAELRMAFGKVGTLYYEFARGIDRRPVQAVSQRKSRGIENTFSTDLVDRSQIVSELKSLAEQLAHRLLRSEFDGTSVTLKVKFSDFRQITRCCTVPEPCADADTLFDNAVALLDRIEPQGKPIRLLGLSVSRPDRRHDNPGQLFFNFDEDVE